MRRPSLVCLALVAACSAPARGTVVGAPADFSSFPGFPGQARSGAVWAEATLCSDQAAVLGQDLVRTGLLPVVLRIGLRADDGAVHRLADDFDPHLYLQDGTVLERVPADEAAAAGGRNQALEERIARLALRPGLLGDWETSAPRFLFFRLPERARVDGDAILVPHGDHYRSLTLSDSLLALDLTHDRPGDERVETLHVGLRSAPWSALR